MREKEEITLWVDNCSAKTKIKHSIQHYILIRTTQVSKVRNLLSNILSLAIHLR